MKKILVTFSALLLMGFAFVKPANGFEWAVGDTIGPKGESAQFCAVDYEGKLWITNYGTPGNVGLYIFNSDGTQASFSPITEGLDENGSALTIANAGGVAYYDSVIYAVSYGNNYILKFKASDGTALNGWQTALSNPGDIDIDDSGHVFVCKKVAAQFAIYDTDGTELTGSPFGTTGWHINRGISVMSDGSKVFLADESSDVIAMYTGSISGTVADYTSGTDFMTGLNNPSACEIDPNGRMWISNTGANEVIITELDGTILQTITDFTSPRGAAFDFDNNLAYVAHFTSATNMAHQLIPAIPELTIAEAKIDANGDFVPDLLNETVTIQGVVTTPNYDAKTNYYLQDTTAGICLQTFSFTSGLNLGDEVTITGKITQYKGLTQINPASETDVSVISTGNVIEPSKITLSELGESTEGMLVEVDSVWIVNLADWPAEGSNANIDLTDGIDTVTLRIDKETDLDGWTPPAGMMKLIAVGSQYTSATPPDDGYQLLGTFREHFMEIIIHPEPEELYTWWENNAGDYTFFQSDNNTRGMDLNPVTGHLLVASRTESASIHILEGENGNYLGSMDMTNVTGGNFAINLVSVANDGVIYGCNLTASGAGFKFYRWGDESSTPTVAFEGDLDQRVGDSFTVTGSGANTIVYASGIATKIYIFTTTDGISFSLFDEIPVSSSLARGGIAPVADTLGSDIWVNCSGKQAALIDTGGTVITTIDTSMNVYFAHIDYMETGDGRKLIAVAGGNCGDVPACMRSEVWDVTNPFNPWRFAYGSMTNTPVANGNGTGVAILEEKEDGVLNLYHLLTNNGIALYCEEIKENTPPTAFYLISPENNATITFEDLTADNLLEVKWSRSFDIDPLDSVTVYEMIVLDESKAMVFDTIYTDTLNYSPIPNNATYQWFVLAKDTRGGVTSSDTFTVIFDIQVSIDEIAGIPKTFALSQNYPNPFNPTTFIKYDLPKEATVKIVIYDLVGRKVRTLVNEKQNAGYKSIIWNGRDNNGQMVSSGMYIYQMITDEFQKTKKMVLLK